MVNNTTPATTNQQEITALDVRIMVIKQRLKGSGKLTGTDLHQCRLEILRAMKDCRRRLGSNHPATIDLIMDLAVTQTRTGRNDEALPNWRKALHFHETSGDREALQASVRNYAECLNRVHRFAEALPYWERALAGENERKPAALNFIRLGLAHALTNVGRPLEALNHLNDALPFYQKKRAEGIWMIGFARCLTYIACINEKLGRMEEARDALRYSITVRENSPNPKPRGILFSKLSLVKNLLADGKLEEAMKERADGEQMAIERLGPGHWLTQAFQKLGPTNPVVVDTAGLEDED